MSPSSHQKKGSIEQLKSRVFDQIWYTETAQLTRVKQLIHFLLKLGLVVARDFMENLVMLQAMALAFKTLLSLAPLLAVIFSILKGFGVHNRLEPALVEALAPLGDKGKDDHRHLAEPFVRPKSDFARAIRNRHPDPSQSCALFDNLGGIHFSLCLHP
jgi:hypothetical protein